MQQKHLAINDISTTDALFAVHDGIRQRRSDGYICATDICKAGGKKWNDYWRLQNTQEYAGHLAEMLSVATSELVARCQHRDQGDLAAGTWVRFLP